MVTFAQDIYNKARIKLFIEKKPKEVINLLSSHPDLNQEINGKQKLRETLALAYFHDKNFATAAEIYKNLGEYYSTGYCELLLGNKEKAYELWQKAPYTPAVGWGLNVLDFLNETRKTQPTFLQIRNHLECDIGCFIEANKKQYVEKIIKNADFLASFNIETYKYIGRILLKFGFFNHARKYLTKSLELMPNDPETYFHLAEYNFAIEAHKEASNAAKRCLEMNSSHTPSKILLNKIKQKSL